MSTDSLTSPCPHTPACPPPVCLPEALRTAPPPATTGGTDPSGYESTISHIDGFAGTLTEAAEGVGLVRQRTPRFEGWNLVPLAGVPAVGLLFAGRFNAIADTWDDSAGILSDVLLTDSGKVGRSAANYRQAESAS